MFIFIESTISCSSRALLRVHIESTTISFSYREHQEHYFVFISRALFHVHISIALFHVHISIALFCVHIGSTILCSYRINL